MRDYDATTERYLEPDPLGLIDGASVYGYVRQSPMMMTDLSGECPMCLVLLAGAAEGVALGYIVDLIWDDGCYTWEQAGSDALWGAAGGAAFKGVSWAWKAAGGGKAFRTFMADEFGGVRKFWWEGHHPVPIFMGGSAEPILVRMRAWQHWEFHRGLNTALRNAFGRSGAGTSGSADAWARFFASTPGAQSQAYDILFDVSQAFDAKNGTSVTSSL